MILGLKQDECFGCAACADVCPTGAITMEADNLGFSYPHLQEEKCIKCGRCALVCPAKHKIETTDPLAYVFRVNNESILKSSSSGGAFYLLSKQILDRDGLVAGCVFDEEMNPKHILADSINDMQKSKYVQSNAEGVYTKTVEALQAKREVLFSGTPCQCHAVMRFVDSYATELLENLTTVAIICRGVYSPGFWSRYKQSQFENLSAYDFRDKSVNNNGHTISWTDNGEEYSHYISKDVFMKLYSRCLMLRSVCYRCPYTSPNPAFDLTIGDAWGVEHTFRDLADGKGTSLVLVRTDRGEELLKGCEPFADIRIIDLRNIMQPALYEPATKPFLNKFFERAYTKLPIEDVLKKFVHD